MQESWVREGYGMEIRNPTSLRSGILVAHLLNSKFPIVNKTAGLASFLHYAQELEENLRTSISEGYLACQFLSMPFLLYKLN
jgi:hypothetical protein